MPDEPPKRHVRMKSGRPRKELELKHTSDNDTEFTNRIPIEEAQHALAHSLPKIALNAQVNDVIQAIKGDNYGRLGIIGRIDPDRYQCYVILKGGGRDYFAVLPDELSIIGRAKKAIKDPIPEHLPSGPETPNINADTSPFGGFK